MPLNRRFHAGKARSEYLSGTTGSQSPSRETAWEHYMSMMCSEASFVPQ